jgi:hypothetical protein
MKIWNSYGSEHSANLVMIGSFKAADQAEKAIEAIDTISAFVCGSGNEFENSDRYPEGLIRILDEIGFRNVSPAELDQFRYGVNPKLEGQRVVIETDEGELSAFMKLLVEKGARVEVYCAHDYPDTGKGRGTRE